MCVVTSARARNMCSISSRIRIVAGGIERHEESRSHPGRSKVGRSTDASKPQCRTSNLVRMARGGGSLSGGEKRRVAHVPRLVSRPDFLILDEPTKSRPRSSNGSPTFSKILRTSSSSRRPLFSRPRVTRIIELYEGKFWSHDATYTDTCSTRRSGRRPTRSSSTRPDVPEKGTGLGAAGPRAQRSKQKTGFERYYDEAAQDGAAVEEDVELVIPPPPQLAIARWMSPISEWNWGAHFIFRLQFQFRNGKASGFAGERPGQNTLLRILIGQLPRRRHGEDRSAHEIQLRGQGRLQLNEERTVLDELSGRHGVRAMGRCETFRAFLSQALSVRRRSHHHAREEAERRRTQPAAARAHPQETAAIFHPRRTTHDLDLPTLRVLGSVDALSGVVCV